ncbi:MAG: glycerol kinase GlpK, partial [Clostridia bacterium]|nr:glycerol kinase GlpK [Clostridia bacterium]
MSSYVIALDQGTASSRAIVFDENGRQVASASRPTTQIYPHPGWVEHDPEEIIASEIASLSEAFLKSGVDAKDVACIGVTNQRETSIIWDKATGKPIYNAIVWQCRRTADICEKLMVEGAEDYIREKTGLLIDAYFSGTKYQWILDRVPGARERAEKGELLAGTVESYLIWNLTGGKAHVSDHSNLSRTMLFDIDKADYDDTLLSLLRVPRTILPTPVGSAEEFGRIAPGIRGIEALAGIPIAGSAGDQAAALFGQCCFEPGLVKNTYGTGCFTLMNVGEKSIRSTHGLVTSAAWTLGGKTTYALEGSVFNAGSSIQWLRDELKLISTARECDVLAESVPDNGGVYVVSAFTGLGAPYWDMYARGAILGLTRGATKAHVARATLEGIAFQVNDLVETMRLDAGREISTLRVDGGASASDVMMQFQADVSGVTVDRPLERETTALGAAFLAGIGVGLWKKEDLASIRVSDRLFTPHDTDTARASRRKWHKAVEKA